MHAYTAAHAVTVDTQADVLTRMPMAQLWPLGCVHDSSAEPRGSRVPAVRGSTSRRTCAYGSGSAEPWGALGSYGG